MDFHPMKNTGAESPGLEAATVEDFVAKVGPLPELEGLGIEEVDLKDEGLAALLERYLNLQTLNLSRTSYSGAKFPVMKNLEEIFAHFTPISDEGLAAILRCPALRSLEIDLGEMTKAGILQIARLRQPALKHVSIRGKHFTEEEALEVTEEIRRACPDLHIEVEVWPTGE
jgi:hypothetical protein